MVIKKTVQNQRKKELKEKFQFTNNENSEEDYNPQETPRYIQNTNKENNQNENRNPVVSYYNNFNDGKNKTHK